MLTSSPNISHYVNAVALIIQLVKYSKSYITEFAQVSRLWCRDRL